MKTIPYPNNDAYTVFSEITETQDIIDEFLTQMNNIIGSRFVNTYEELKKSATALNNQIVYFS